jgi:uncharacterized protein (TIGR03083 family)
MTIWDDVASERRQLADVLEGLTEAQLSEPSLCDGWTVKDTAAHLTTTFHTSMPKFMVQIVMSGGFNNATRKAAIREASSRSIVDIAEELRANAEHRFTPPGLGAEAPLTDIVMHGQDIRRPLDIDRDIPEEEARIILDLLVSKKGKFAWPRGGVGGLRFEATDMDWSSGSGPLVSGAAEALLMAIGGRAAAVEDLAGDGVAAFRTRF